MRIFFYFGELQTPMYQWQRRNHIDELQRNGHEVITFNPYDYASMDEANEKAILELDKAGRIDLFLACDDQTVIYPELGLLLQQFIDEMSYEISNMNILVSRL